MQSSDESLISRDPPCAATPVVSSRLGFFPDPKSSLEFPTGPTPSSPPKFHPHATSHNLLLIHPCRLSPWTASQEPELLLPDDVSDADSSSDSEHKHLTSDADSGYDPETESSQEWEVDVIVLSDNEPDEVQMAPRDVTIPIDVDALPNVPDVVVVKQEEADKVPVQEEVDDRKGNTNASNKRPANVVVRRSERLKAEEIFKLQAEAGVEEFQMQGQEEE